jgi:hypothetical protein
MLKATVFVAFVVVIQTVLLWWTIRIGYNAVEAARAASRQTDEAIALIQRCLAVAER